MRPLREMGSAQLETEGMYSQYNEACKANKATWMKWQISSSSELWLRPHQASDVADHPNAMAATKLVRSGDQSITNHEHL